MTDVPDRILRRPTFEAQRATTLKEEAPTSVTGELASPFLLLRSSTYNPRQVHCG